MFVLVDKKSKKVVDAKATMNLAKGGYDIEHQDGKVEFLTVPQYNKKYETRVMTDKDKELAKVKKIEEKEKETPKAKTTKTTTKTTKPKGAKHVKEAMKEEIKEELKKEASSKTIEAPSKPLEAKKKGIEPSPIIEMVKKAFKDFEAKDENITQDVKTKVTNFKYKGRVLVEIHYQKRKVKCLFNEKGLSQANLNLCTMVNPNFKWSTNAEYNIQTENQIQKAMDMLQEAYTHRKEAFATSEAKKDTTK